MKSRLSDQVRDVAQETFVKPAHDAGKKEFSIPVKELMRILENQGFPRNHTPQICNALQTDKFLLPNGLRVTHVDGPKSKTSTTVVIHYSISGSTSGTEMSRRFTVPAETRQEESEVRARRLTDKLRGLLKEEIAAYGGADAFMRWVRSEDEDAA
ncbi:MAG TPA: hypothetical protein VE178_13380 [Silvibacterium sp.]|jgi:hypothetical protein|nr:hypothetical protein [Silvibacterium sp.]